MTNAFEIRLKDSLREVTRKERRSLFGVSALGIVMVRGGLIPTKISALGIDFSPTDQKTLLRTVAFVVVYFLMAFLIYAAADFLDWYHKLKQEALPKSVPTSSKDEIGREIDMMAQESFAGRVFVLFKWNISRFFVHLRDLDISLLKPVTLARAFFDFGIPTLVGGYSIWSLMTF